MSNPYRKSSNSYKNIFSNNTSPYRNSYKIQNIDNEYDKVSQKDKDHIKSENDIDTETLKQDFPDTYNYIIAEIDRLKSLDSSLNNLQALNLAIGSNCGSTDNYDMCPTRRKNGSSSNQHPPNQPPPNQPPLNQPPLNQPPTNQPPPNNPPTNNPLPTQPPPNQPPPNQPHPNQNQLEQRNFKEKGNCVGEGCRIKFNNTKNLASKIKELNIDFYSNNRCGFCKRAKDLFMSENVIDGMNVLENKQLPKGVDGFPHFYSNTTGKSHTGAPSTVKMLVDKLS